MLACLATLVSLESVYAPSTSSSTSYHQQCMARTPHTGAPTAAVHRHFPYVVPAWYLARRNTSQCCNMVAALLACSRCIHGGAHVVRFLLGCTTAHACCATTSVPALRLSNVVLCLVLHSVCRHACQSDHVLSVSWLLLESSSCQSSPVSNDQAACSAHTVHALPCALRLQDCGIGLDTSAYIADC